MTFDSGGSFNATAACNQVSGWYMTSGSNLAILPGPSTLACCGEGSMGDLHVLGPTNTSSYAVADGQRTLTPRRQGHAPVHAGDSTREACLLSRCRA